MNNLFLAQQFSPNPFRNLPPKYLKMKKNDKTSFFFYPVFQQEVYPWCKGNVFKGGGRRSILAMLCKYMSLKEIMNLFLEM